MTKQDYDNQAKLLKEQKADIKLRIQQAKALLFGAKQDLLTNQKDFIKLECVKLYGRELVEGDILEVQFPSYNAKTDAWGTRLVRLYYQQFNTAYPDMFFIYADEKGKPIPNSGGYNVTVTDLKHKMFREAILVAQ